MIPRLVAGAHWGQDDYIGGVIIIALLALGWSYYTAFLACATGLLLRATAPIFKLVARIPLFKCLSVLGA